MLVFLFIVALPAVTLAQITSLKPFNLTATALFFDADKNLNGNIDRHEVDDLFRAYDRDGNGRVSRFEYTSYVDAHSPTLHDLHDALFDVYDVDNDHILDKHDYDNFYALMDGDGNGLVTHFEFVRYWEILLGILENSLGRSANNK